MVLALEMLGPPFHFLMTALGNMFVFAAKLDVTPKLGLQRHWVSKGVPKASQGVPKAPKSLQNDTKMITQ